MIFVGLLLHPTGPLTKFYAGIWTYDRQQAPLLSNPNIVHVQGPRFWPESGLRQILGLFCFIFLFVCLLVKNLYQLLPFDLRWTNAWQLHKMPIHLLTLKSNSIVFFSCHPTTMMLYMVTIRTCCDRSAMRSQHMNSALVSWSFVPR